MNDGNHESAGSRPRLRSESYDEQRPVFHLIASVSARRKKDVLQASWCAMPWKSNWPENRERKNEKADVIGAGRLMVIFGDYVW
jgi:hypothetical protein